MKFFIKVSPHHADIICTVRHVIEPNNEKAVESYSLAVEGESWVILDLLYHYLTNRAKLSVYCVLSCSEAKLQLAQTSSPCSEWLPPVLLGIWSHSQTASVNRGKDYTGHGVTHCSALVNLVRGHDDTVAFYRLIQNLSSSSQLQNQVYHCDVS